MYDWTTSGRRERSAFLSLSDRSSRIDLFDMFYLSRPLTLRLGSIHGTGHAPSGINIQRKRRTRHEPGSCNVEGKAWVEEPTFWLQPKG
jgi:hypothetical protein